MCLKELWKLSSPGEASGLSLALSFNSFCISQPPKFFTMKAIVDLSLLASSCSTSGHCRQLELTAVGDHQCCCWRVPQLPPAHPSSLSCLLGRLVWRQLGSSPSTSPSRLVFKDLFSDHLLALLELRSLGEDGMLKITAKSCGQGWCNKA